MYETDKRRSPENHYFLYSRIAWLIFTVSNAYHSGKVLFYRRNFFLWGLSEIVSGRRNWQSVYQQRGNLGNQRFIDNGAGICDCIHGKLHQFKQRPKKGNFRSCHAAHAAANNYIWFCHYLHLWQTGADYKTDWFSDNRCIQPAGTGAWIYHLYTAHFIYADQ